MNLLLLSRNMGAIKNYLLPNSNIGFIGTAGDVYPNPWFVIEDKEKLIKLNYNIINIDITKEDSNTIREKLNTIDALYVSGGNVYYLIQEINKKNIKEDIINFINSNKLYIGASAGSCVCSNSTELYQDLDDPNMATELTLSGLGIIDFNIFPHYGKEKYAHVYDKVIEEYQTKYKIVPLRDNEALIVKDIDIYDILQSNDIIE